VADVVPGELAHPEVIELASCGENINAHVEIAKLSRKCSKAAISQINCSMFCWRVASHWLCALECMLVILENRYHVIFIEQWYPVEQSSDLLRDDIV